MRCARITARQCARDASAPRAARSTSSGSATRVACVANDGLRAGRTRLGKRRARGGLRAPVFAWCTEQVGVRACAGACRVSWCSQPWLWPDSRLLPELPSGHSGGGSGAPGSSALSWLQGACDLETIWRRTILKIHFHAPTLLTCILPKPGSVPKPCSTTRLSCAGFSVTLLFSDHDDSRETVNCHAVSFSFLVATID